MLCGKGLSFINTTFIHYHGLGSNYPCLPGKELSPSILTAEEEKHLKLDKAPPMLHQVWRKKLTGEEAYTENT